LSEALAETVTDDPLTRVPAAGAVRLTVGGVVSAPEVKVTLSSAAVASTPARWEVTASPTKTLVAMVMVVGLPCCTQVTPSLERKPVKVLPLRTSFTQ
jgi:hypothetical protein